MKKVYVNEEWCLGCRLCEYNCAFANTDLEYMFELKGEKIYPRVTVESGDKINYAVSCRHCDDPLCMKSCIAGAISKDVYGVVTIDRDKCVGCHTCILVCPYGALSCDGAGTATKCELCTRNKAGRPACVDGCPNKAIVYEERG